MKEIIEIKLSEIAFENKIKILFACESGSRGWGFPSPDSDFDVRFMYVRTTNFYLSVSDYSDQIDFPINDELDINGWDLRKVLKLISKSNTTAFEWLQSPIIYQESESFKDELWNICQFYFNQKSNIHHYLGIANNALETIGNENEIKIKKLFYVLRSMLSAKWCLERKTIAPMNISPLLTLVPDNFQIMINELIELKANSAEGQLIEIDSDLKEYINNEFEYCTKESKKMEKQYFDIENLDRFFIETLRKHDN
ncbi:nucleotidyltransferase domain-containing protein [Sphingobacterium hungaricum]|uniref:Nucleotidyltransferase domain-containing protein n=1 Tax=Sphingobacterium hungaricum TaxID=2082723 RepID=A0A928UVE0_9SPHI|nr:nucleotidyltransferase domain-containing protein [Sphingobacterium hungaricum]MBE8712593.1 nucleotidyltransferase domain-containing protein [Sphingobacterium hungaricum]